MAVVRTSAALRGLVMALAAVMTLTATIVTAQMTPPAAPAAVPNGLTAALASLNRNWPLTGRNCSSYQPDLPVALRESANNTKSMCANMVTWEINSSRAGKAQFEIEGLIQEKLGSLIDKNEQMALQAMFPVCLESVLRFVCTQAFPTCTTGSLAPGLACKSTCTDFTQRCALPFKLRNKLSLLPDCENNLLKQLFEQPGSCTNVAAPLGSILKPGVCPSYLKTYPNELNKYNDPSNKLGGQCFGRCCFPCPKMQVFYEEGKVNNVDKITIIVRAVSSVAALYVFVSYLVLPNKRKHPAIIVFFFAMAMTFWMGNIWLSFPDARQVQCAVDAQSGDGLSEVLESRFATNQQCTIQGTFLVFFAHLAIVWAVYLVFNLHLSAVWRSNFLERNFHSTSLFCWLWPLGFTIAAYGMGAIEYNAGATCFLSVAQSGTLFFYPLAGLIGVATLLHSWTFLTIARSSFKESMSLDNSGPMSQTGSRNKSADPYAGQSSSYPTTSQSMASGAQGSGGASGRRRAKHAARAVKVQWRALLLSLELIVTFIIFFFFYNFEATKLAITGTEPWFQQWVRCTIIDKRGQNICAAEAAPNLPSFWLMVTTDMIVSLAGVLLFIIFGARMSLVYEWRTWFANLGGGRKAQPYAGYI
ncbi:hypothetical protein BC828DRAFT_403550 [Blastocladiella britannica]|nr:hypothetical protein BC828DRAFT_403550 [Blastocladiella britannica]